MRRPPQRIPLFLVVALLLISLVHAAPAGAAPREGPPSFSFFRFLAGLWNEIGIEIDPNGRPGAVPPDGEIGIVIDPNGRTGPSGIFGSIGIVLDPSGQPASSPTPAEIGIVLDPDGQPSH